MEINPERKEDYRIINAKHEIMEELFSRLFDGSLSENEFSNLIVGVLEFRANPYKALTALLLCSKDQSGEIAQAIEGGAEFEAFVARLQKMNYKLLDKIARLGEEEDGYKNVITGIKNRPFYLVRPKTPAVHVGFRSFDKTVLEMTVNLATFAHFVEACLTVMNESLSYLRQSNVEISERERKVIFEKLESIANIAVSVRDKGLP